MDKQQASGGSMIGFAIIILILFLLFSLYRLLYMDTTNIHADFQV